MTWKVGDWVIFDLSIGQIMEIRDGGFQDFSDGAIRTSGRLADRFRPLTLRGKAIVEAMSYYYKSLSEIDGEAGFNYPDISSHFAWLALCAIDGKEDDSEPFDKARQFVQEARDYKREIQGVRLFRHNLSRARL